jgi:hypothetical protein
MGDPMAIADAVVHELGALVAYTVALETP